MTWRIEEPAGEPWMASGYYSVPAETRRFTWWERFQIRLADRAQEFAHWLYGRVR